MCSPPSTPTLPPPVSQAQRELPDLAVDAFIARILRATSITAAVMQVSFHHIYPAVPIHFVRCASNPFAYPVRANWLGKALESIA